MWEDPPKQQTGGNRDTEMAASQVTVFNLELPYCNVIQTLPFLDAPLAPCRTREISWQHLDRRVLERERLTVRNEGRGCHLGRDDVYLLTVSAMTVFPGIFTR